MGQTLPDHARLRGHGITGVTASPGRGAAGTRLTSRLSLLCVLPCANHVPDGTLSFGVCKAGRTMRPLPRRIEDFQVPDEEIILLTG
ncbi:TYMS opposite strand protein-like [Pongo pygmaeus]|uniref:TYMS opposite strand protein-like n=1 Tax=Pongo pygmaeus TaxID=9600 RepID=UPI00300CC160